MIFHAIIRLNLSNPNTVSLVQGDTPEVIGRHLNITRIQAQQTSSTRCRRVLGLVKLQQSWQSAVNLNSCKQCVNIRVGQQLPTLFI